MKTIFFDRDGVLIKDVHLLTKCEQIILYPETFEAFKLLDDFNNSTTHPLNIESIVVTNQPVVARGMISEEEVKIINNYISNQILLKTGYQISKSYFCPHHPNANIKKYRVNCKCRKPKSGMLLKAAKEFSIDLTKSWMIGDRISDIIAGHNVGCKTILVETGKHTEKPIESDALDIDIKPDFICKNILEAVKIIIDE